MSFDLAANNSGNEAYWFRQPLALLHVAPPDAALNGVAPCGDTSALGFLKRAFLPTKTQSALSPTNVNRITRVAIIVIVLLAIILRSWWPVAIGAGLMLLALVVAYGLQVSEQRRARERRARSYAGGVNDSLSSSLSSQSPRNSARSFGDEQGSIAASVIAPSAFLGDADYDKAANQSRLWGSTASLASDNGGGGAPSWFADPNYDSANAAVGCDGYPQCGPGGPTACASAAQGDPRASIPNPSRHNTYEQVDARYRLYATKPQPVTTEDQQHVLAAQRELQQQLDAQREVAANADALQASWQSSEPSPSSSSGELPSGAPALGIDPHAASSAQLPRMYQQPTQLQTLPPSLQSAASSASSNYMTARSDLLPDQEAMQASELVPSPIKSSAVDADVLPPDATQPLTQTESMLERMYRDVDEYSWNETVAKRAPRWQQNPSDPRTRRKMEQDAVEMQSWRGFHWNQSS